ncbi:MAG: ribonuclease P protein component [Gammaproteobacteria bacterium]|nr:ribonuclease P protein component [Gammaproteobacteria bacterium]
MANQPMAEDETDGHAEKCTGQCFPKTYRLLSSADFQCVFKATECRSSDNALTVLARHNGLDHARLGMAISKRFIKTAVGRNRVKRLIRESFRQHYAILSGLDIVVLNRDAAHTTSNPDLTKALKAHWRRVAKRCEKS